MSLRDELLGVPATVPQFSLVLPSGWEEFEADAAAERRLLQLAASKFRQAHRPDLYAQLRAQTGRAFAGMRSAQTVRFYIQTSGWSDELVLPLSITALLRTASGGGSLDALVTDLIRTHGATALRGDRRFVRWTTESTVSVGSTRVGQRTFAYLTPLPEAGRRRAMQFAATAVHPLDDPDEAWRPLVEGMGELADAVVSTMRWHAA